MMRRQLVGLALFILVGVAVSSARIGGGSAAATTTPTATSTPPATPLPAGTLRILVFNDLNSNGLPDTGEPGLANWHVIQGCSDAVLWLTTDAKGEVMTRLFGGDDCFSLTRQFGWLPTRGNIHVRIGPDWNTADPLMFGLHDLGRNVMELRGEAITGGLPAEQGAPGVEEPFRSCGHLFFESTQPAGTYAVVIVEGADTRSGCPHQGDNVVPSSDGVPPTPAPALQFLPGTIAATSWVANGDSMRFMSVSITDAWVLDVVAGRLTQHCAETREVNGFLPAGSARVFVLSDHVRPGCGAPGRRVRLFRDGLPLEPDIEWRAGDVSQTLPRFDLAPPADTRITPPETGSAGLLDARADRAWHDFALTFGMVTAFAAVALSLRALARRR
jgi:hypothetical protein